MSSEINNPQRQNLLPAHLQNLLEPTPSGVAKLLAAWDGLQAEHHVLILEEVKRRAFPIRLAQKAYTKALDSPIAYVRYLAAKNFSQFHDDANWQPIRAKIEADPEPLVRYSLQEKGDMALTDEFRHHGSNIEAFANTFFALPHEARLAKVRGLYGCTKIVADLIDVAIEHGLRDGRVSEGELYELLEDYLARPRFKEYLRSEASFFRRILDPSLEDSVEAPEALWRLVPRLPERLSYLLIRHLPEYTQGESVPSDVIGALDEHQLGALLWRPDIGLKEVRRRVFRQEVKKMANGTSAPGILGLPLSAAVSHHFDLSYASFGALIRDFQAAVKEKPAGPERRSAAEAKIKPLQELASSANGLSLVLYKVLWDILPTGGADALRTLKRRLRDGRGPEHERQFRELRLYHLAERAAEWTNEHERYLLLPEEEKRGPLPDQLAFLADQIKDGDTWGTFIGFSRAWAERFSWGRKADEASLEKHLPEIAELEDEGASNGEERRDARVMSELVEKLKAQVDELRTAFSPNGSQKRTSVAEAISSLAQQRKQSDEQVLKLLQALSRQVSNLEAWRHLTSRILIAVVVLAIIIWAFS